MVTVTASMEESHLLSIGAKILVELGVGSFWSHILQVFPVHVVKGHDVDALHPTNFPRVTFPLAADADAGDVDDVVSPLTLPM